MSALLTRAELSGCNETSLHGDVMRFVEGLRALDDARLHVTSFGQSPEGRALPLLVLNANGIHTPEQARAAGLPVVLVINGIHAGEVEGKEASLMMVRHMLGGEGPRGMGVEADVHEGDVLEHMVLVIVPLFNPDGNDRIDPTNRRLDLARLEGQIGPFTGVGTRVNASGINLNRDYMRQDSEEMRLLQARVCQRWDPDLTIDCHSTNGSVHRFALTYDIPHTVESGRAEPIAFMRERLLPVVRERLRGRTGLETFYYGNFVADEGGEGSGWMTYTHHPRFGSNYRGLTNRLDLLLETYSYLDFPERVRTTYEFLRETLRWVAERGRDVVEVVEASRRPPDRIAVRYRLDAFEGTVDILTREPRTLEGAPVSARIPYLGRFVGTEVVERPFAYHVPPLVAERLRGHGLHVRRLAAATAAHVEVATIEATVAEGSRRILEASTEGETELAATCARVDRRLDEGSWIVETEQPRGAIAVYMCEPHSDDGAFACGFLPGLQTGAEYPITRVLEPLAGPFDDSPVQ